MIELAARKRNPSRLVGLVAGVLAATTVACGTTNLEIPIETPIQPKLDVSAFQRVLIAGFVTGMNDDVDANQETVRLLRSQLRSKSSLKVIDADVMALTEIAQDQSKGATESDDPPVRDVAAAGASGANTAADRGSQPTPLPAHIKDQKDIEPYERIFANIAYWKRIGEEYQNPLIVTGTVLFMPNTRAGLDRKSTRLNSSHIQKSRMPSSA